MDSYKELLDKARELCKEENRKYKDDGDTHLRESGFILEDRHQLLYPKQKRLSTRGKKMDFDFILNNYYIDVKGDWREDYNGTIFIESVANIQKNTRPAFLKPENKDKDIFLWYVSFLTGEEAICNWNKLYEEIRYKPTCLGGYKKNVLGWRVNPKEYTNSIRIIRRD